MATHPRRSRALRGRATTPHPQETTPRKKAGRPKGPPVNDCQSTAPVGAGGTPRSLYRPFGNPYRAQGPSRHDCPPGVRTLSGDTRSRLTLPVGTTAHKVQRYALEKATRGHRSTGSVRLDRGCWSPDPIFDPICQESPAVSGASVGWGPVVPDQKLTKGGREYSDRPHHGQPPGVHRRRADAAAEIVPSHDDRQSVVWKPGSTPCRLCQCA